MNPSPKRPYLSIVAASRNDDHGGGMMQRMCMFVRGLDQQAKRHDMNAELVLVDWNPPPGKPRLHEVLPPPAPDSPLVIRYITITNETHRRWRNWETIPLFQMIAKNVGIRRSQGEFVLCTNVDLLFSDRLCEYIAREKLDPLKMYRANRCDVPDSVPENATIKEQLAYCEKHVIRRCGRTPGMTVCFKTRIKRVLQSMFGRPFFSLSSVDTDGCGDFTLLSKKVWEDIRGYPELGMFSIYLDGLGVHAAASMGYEALTLPPDHCTFHVEHHTGWMSLSITEKIKLMQERPFLDYATYIEAVRWMLEHRQPLPINDENWGCIQDQFPEICITKQSTEGEKADA